MDGSCVAEMIPLGWTAVLVWVWVFLGKSVSFCLDLDMC